MSVERLPFGWHWSLWDSSGNLGYGVAASRDEAMRRVERALDELERNPASGLLRLTDEPAVIVLRPGGVADDTAAGPERRCGPWG